MFKVIFEKLSSIFNIKKYKKCNYCNNRRFIKTINFLFKPQYIPCPNCCTKDYEFHYIMYKKMSTTEARNQRLKTLKENIRDNENSLIDGVIYDCEYCKDSENIISWNFGCMGTVVSCPVCKAEKYEKTYMNFRGLTQEQASQRRLAIIKKNKRNNLGELIDDGYYYRDRN